MLVLINYCNCHENCLSETVLMWGHNMFLVRKVKKIFYTMHATSSPVGRR